MREYCLGNRDGTVDTSLSPVRAPEIEILKKNIFDRKTKMRAHCSGNLDGTVDTFLLPVRPPEIEISKKYILDRKTKMRTHCLGNRDCTGDTFLSPVRPQEIEILKKNFGTEKRNYAHIVQGIAMVPLTLFFHLCELRKSRYQRKNF